MAFDPTESRNWSRQLNSKLAGKARDAGSTNIVSDEDDGFLFTNTKEEEGSPRAWILKHRSGQWRRTGTGIDAVARGHYQFVVDEDGTTRIGKTGHFGLTQGYPVRFAGEVLFKAGTLIAWNNKSGHYVPSGYLAAQAPFPAHLFSSQFDREDHTLLSAMDVTTNNRRLAQFTGWSIEDVVSARKRLKL